MFVACGIRCLADVSSVSPSSEQLNNNSLSFIIHAIHRKQSASTETQEANLS